MTIKAELRACGFSEKTIFWWNDFFKSNIGIGVGTIGITVYEYVDKKFWVDINNCIFSEYSKYAGTGFPIEILMNLLQVSSSYEELNMLVNKYEIENMLDRL